jgi:SAM-dependent methyltransferase
MGMLRGARDNDVDSLPLVRFRLVEEFPGWKMAPELLQQMIERYHPKTILEIGSGANPSLSIAEVSRYGIDYITSDRDEAELAKADPVYSARCIDVSEGPIPADLCDRCDMVFSRMVNEHIRDGQRYHANVYRLLAPGGVAVHCFSTLFALPFLANYLISSKWNESLYRLFGQRDEHQHAKFPAYYSWCRGPNAGALRRLASIGYEIIAYDGFFGHYYYESRAPWLHRLEKVKARLLLKIEAPGFCSYAVVILSKPVSAAGAVSEIT